jgi:hypothetical protein
MEVGAVKASTRYHERQFDTSLRDRKRVARLYNSEVERFSKRKKITDERYFAAANAAGAYVGNPLSAFVTVRIMQ